MTQKTQQNLFNYLHFELGATALESNMKDLETIVLEEKRYFISQKERGERNFGIAQNKFNNYFYANFLHNTTSNLSEVIEALNREIARLNRDTGLYYWVKLDSPVESDNGQITVRVNSEITIVFTPIIRHQ
jgi:hypothetical protein